MKRLYQLFLIVVLSLFSLTVNADEIYWELKEAYDWCYEKWITTQSITNARFSSSITRQATAKMIVKFAIDVLWKSPDYWKACQFTDDDITEDLVSFVTRSCQLDLMWQNTYKFNPMWNVTRAQFWTILSRILWWDQYNTPDSASTPYYEKHLKALQDAKILWYVSNPMEYVETRWNIMLMLLRAYKYKYWVSDSISPYSSSTNKDYTIKTLEVVSDISSNWSMSVIESYTVNYNEKKRGLDRYLPLKANVWWKTYFLDVSKVIVTWAIYSSSKDSSNIYLKIWDPNNYVQWEKKYAISYDVYWLINDYSSNWDVQLYWDILWSWFDTEIDKVKITLFLPKLYKWFEKNDILITVNWRTTNMEWFNWTVDTSSSSKIIITYDRGIYSDKTISVAVKFPKDYFSLKKPTYYWTWEDVYTWYIEKILPLAKIETKSHLYEFLQDEKEYKEQIDSMTGSWKTFLNDDALDDVDDPQKLLELLNNVRDLQLKYDRSYKNKLTTLLAKLETIDDKYELEDRIFETIDNIELTDALLDVIYDALEPLLTAAIEYWDIDDIPTSVQEKLLNNVYIAMWLSLDYQEELDDYLTYVNKWAHDVYDILTD